MRSLCTASRRALLLLGGLVLLGGALLQGNLLQAVDEQLSGQAAVEAISLFDNKEEPHLHLSKSPLLPEVVDFVAARAIYGPDGARLVSEDRACPLPDRMPASETVDTHRPILRTVETTVGPARELRVRVISPEGRPHTLLLRSPLGRIQATVGTYYRVLGLLALAAAVLLLAVQLRLSGWWAGRIHNVIEHMRRVEVGDLASRPRPDPAKDELGELTTAIARATERLEEARRAQDRLVADAAHELRTPLAAMRTEVDVALRRPRDAESLRETLTDVREEVDRLDQLSTKLLDLARFASGVWRVEDGNVRAVLDAATEAQRPLAEAKGVEVEVAGPAIVNARFDPTALRQAVENLLSNAIKFSPAGGRVLARLDATAEAWRLAVHDDGPGIPASDRNAVFEPFHRLDARIAGTGLGLAIVRDVARHHRGRAFVADESTGTTVVLEAPA
ncbi:MAG: HAMP domain-containing histidine kinase [Myxococcales bacterium]|nr:HAMP domain-containing histidine kinase [Myxococcales bacterium]